MNEQNPYEKLGLKETASFDDIQAAKQRLIQQNSNDPQIIEEIESAYDAIIMDRLRLRQEGKIKVPERIRFPEKTTVEKPSTAEPPSIPVATSWLKNFLDTPSKTDILLSAAIFVILIGLSVSSSQFPLSLFMACGLAANVYLLNRKEQRFGRSLLISLVGLVIGVSIGAGLASLINAQNGFNLLNNDQWTAVVSLIVFWLISSFLR